MSSPLPPKPQTVPETDATYERTNPDNDLERADATSPSGPAIAGGTAKGPDKGVQRSDGQRTAPLPAGGKIEGDMTTEEPEGWDLAPTDIKDPRQQRHPRPDGVGGSEPDSAKRDPKR